jgi:hypothetical protein
MEGTLKRFLSCCFALVVCLNIAQAQTQRLGAIVQTWHLDPVTNMVTLTIANVSHKDITAFNIAIKEIYADGSENTHELLEDYSGRLAFIKEHQNDIAIRQQFGDGLFHPGETREELIAVQPGLRDIQSVVDVVKYADSTDETTNPEGLKRLHAHRQADLASRQLANKIIRDALADPNDPNPSATAARKIQEQITLYKAQKHSNVELETGTLRGMLDELKQTNSRDALNKYAAKNDERIATLAPHAKGEPQ